jgi:4-hydroxy-3-polyprenylbenzoate decarboxylase
MVSKDLREFIEALDKSGDMVRIKRSVDWDLEVGAISRRACEAVGPATLFEKIKGYPKGFRILGGALATWRRVAVAMGLDPETSIREIHYTYEERIGCPIKPLMVNNSPRCNVLLGEDIDLYAFPSPMCHELDGGRYIGTWDVVVSKDPTKAWTNWGMYRFMVHNSRYLIGSPTPASHLGVMLKERFLPRASTMPIAVVIGADMLSSLTAATGHRMGESEVNFAGGLRLEPVELIKCKTNDLMVPANAEIVIEGEILLDATAPEGPFGEYTGYRRESNQTGTLVRVTAITYRDEPIITMSSLGIPPDDSSIAGAMGVSVALKRRLLGHKLPITDVFLPPEGASHLVVVGVKSGGSEVAKEIREVISGRRAWYTKIVVVDEDVDVFDIGQVIHALAVKCHSYRGIHLSEQEGVASPVTPCYSRQEKEKLLGATALFDCTWPREWPNDEIPVKMSFEEAYSSEIKSKVVKNWSRYGFK